MCGFYRVKILQVIKFAVLFLLVNFGFISNASAGGGTVFEFTVDLVPSFAGLTQTSPGNYTIRSEDLPAATNNSIPFTATANLNTDIPDFRIHTVETDPDFGGTVSGNSASQLTLTSSAFPFDRVAKGGTAQTYTATASSYVWIDGFFMPSNCQEAIDTFVGLPSPACAQATSSIIVLPLENIVPTANAGSDQTVDSGSMVTLMGSGADSDGSIASYLWVRTGGTGGPITLSDATVASPTFTADTLLTTDSPVTHIFTLTTTDNDGANSTSDSVTITVSPPDDTDKSSRLINNFVRNRAGNLLDATPDISDRLDGDSALGNNGTFAFIANYSEQKTAISFGGSLSRFFTKKNKQALPTGLLGYAASPEETISQSQNPYNLWVRGGFNQSKQFGTKQQFGFAQLGADYRVNKDLLFGALVQYDRASETDNSTSAKISGNGWLFGPYAVVRLHEKIVFDGQAYYGGSKNKITPVGTYTDEFSTNRVLLNARLTGNLNFNDVIIAPQIMASYLRETQNAYVDSNNGAIPEQSIEVGRLVFGPKIYQTFALDNGVTVKPSAKIQGVWTFKDTGYFDVNTGLRQAGSNSSLSARIDLGLDVTSEAYKLGFKAFYGDIGRSNYESYGGSGQLKINF